MEPEAIKTINVPIEPFMKDVSFKVSLNFVVGKIYSIRIGVAKLFFYIGAKIMGTGIEFTTK